MSSFTAFNLVTLLDTVGEEEVIDALSDFSCDKNAEIESFVRRNALDFTKKRMSITYLVIDDDNGELAAIFTLTHKAIQINNAGLSKTAMKRMQRFAQLDEFAGVYFVSAFLIAQLGKNSAYSGKITGTEILGMVQEVMKKVQSQIGGGLEYLECEEKDSLLKFYQNETNGGFKIFDERYSLVDNTKYIQLFKFI